MMKLQTLAARAAGILAATLGGFDGAQLNDSRHITQRKSCHLAARGQDASADGKPGHVRYASKAEANSDAASRDPSAPSGSTNRSFSKI